MKYTHDGHHVQQEKKKLFEALVCSRLQNKKHQIKRHHSCINITNQTSSNRLENKQPALANWNSKTLPFFRTKSQSHYEKKKQLQIIFEQKTKLYLVTLSYYFSWDVDFSTYWISHFNNRLILFPYMVSQEQIYNLKFNI